MIARMLALLVLFTCALLEIASADSPVPANVLRITMDKTPSGQLEVVLDAKGHKEKCSLGTLVSQSMRLLAAKGMEGCTVNRTQPILVDLKRDEYKKLITYVTDTKGVKAAFSFSFFISALADSLDGCQEYSGNELAYAGRAQIFFERDSRGEMQTVIMDGEGKKEPLDLGTFICNTSETMADCKATAQADRLIQIIFDMSNPKDVKVYQIDAYGAQEVFSMDNLVTAAAETLQICDTSKDAPQPIKIALPSSIKIKFKRSSTGQLTAALIDSMGMESILDLDSLMVATTQAVPFFIGHGQSSLDISYERDAEGVLQGYVTNLEGNKVPLSLNSLIEAAGYFYGGVGI